MTEQHVRFLIGNVLRLGVLLAAGVVIAGLGHILLHFNLPGVEFSAFKSQPERLRTPAAIIHDTFGGHGRSMIMLGILILMATPVVRVGLSAALFAAEKDAIYVAITLVVLLILLSSLFSAHLQAG